MRNIINMIIKIAIIWGAAWMFPEYVKIQDTRTMVLVVATLLIASIVLTVIMMRVLILAALPGNGVGIGIAMLITIIMALASGIIQLMAAVHFVPGFEIHGKLTYIILKKKGKKEDKLNKAALAFGTQVTCQAIKNVGSDIWILVPSGWIAAYYDGNVYVK